MKRLVLLLILFTTPASAESWVFLPSYYSHDARGRRVTQYATPTPAYRPHYDGYRQIVHRYQHQHIHIGGSCDHWDQIETWKIE